MAKRWGRLAHKVSAVWQVRAGSQVRVGSRAHAVRGGIAVSSAYLGRLVRKDPRDQSVRRVKPVRRAQRVHLVRRDSLVQLV
ncbi:MAG: hypothetical protein EBY84_04370, partial [Acidimicrobiia bacterium]|nr:hypothetical protein [Acidimicrobiia bacterium]